MEISCLVIWLHSSNQKAVLVFVVVWLLIANAMFPTLFVKPGSGMNEIHQKSDRRKLCYTLDIVLER